MPINRYKNAFFVGKCLFFQLYFSFIVMRNPIFNSLNLLINLGDFRRQWHFFFFIHLPQAFPVIFIFSFTLRQCDSISVEIQGLLAARGHPSLFLLTSALPAKPQTLKSPDHPLKAAISLNVAATTVPAGVVNFTGSEKKRKTPAGAERNGLQELKGRDAATVQTMA